MNRYRITYNSMTAFYNLGYVYADSKEDAEREARKNQTAFRDGEKCLIKAHIEN